MKHLITILLTLSFAAGQAQNLTGLLNCTKRGGVDSLLVANGYLFGKKAM